MKKRKQLLPLVAVIASTMACILQMEAPFTLSPDQVNTLAAQTMAFLQYQTYVALGTQALPPPADTAAPPSAAIDTPTGALLPTVTQTGTMPPTATFMPTVTPTALPCNWAQFISDVTVPDDWETTPSDHFTKTWRLKNIGSCTWTSGYALVFDHGEPMGAPAPQQLTTGTVPPGGTIDVSVDLVSPATAGTYQGFFMLRASDSSLFGIGAGADEAFWVKIKVYEPTLPPPVVAPTTHAVYSQVTVAPGTVGHTTATCPAGTVVTGGGYSVSNTGMWAYIQRKNGNGWVVYAQNNSGANKTLTAYAVCLTYPSAATSDVSTNRSVAAGHSESMTAACPAGTVAVGGGYTGSVEGKLITYFSGLSGNGWRVSEKNIGSGTANFHAYAVCLSGVSASTTSVSGHVDIPPSSGAFAEAVCPGGMVMTSGGFSIDTDLVVYYTSLYSGKWRVYAHNTGTHTQALAARGTCLSVS
ncbi:MAG: hypothetical protein JW929_06375 [Anaerolineales bacterium]|nr:hypothetical protein [Anaerolineales bacterium]